MKEQFFDRDALWASQWKNGGGVTREIMSSPDHAPFWRLSIANVDTEGPFSTFNGLERILTVVEGAGMILARDTGDVNAVLHKPVRFAGSDQVMGLLPYGPIQNFNVIFDATELDAKVTVARDAGMGVKDTIEPALTLAYCLTGAFQVQGSGQLRPCTGVLNPSGKVIAADDTSSALFLAIWPKRR